MTRPAAQLAALTTLIGDRWPDGQELRQCAELARTMPRAIGHMVAVTADGFSASTAGNPDRVGARSTSGDGMLSTVARRDRSTAAYGALSAHLADAAASLVALDRYGVRDALRDAQRVVDVWQPPVVVQASASRCAAIGTETMEPWYREDCTDLAVKAGLCANCFMRRYRWRKAQDEHADAG